MRLCCVKRAIVEGPALPDDQMVHVTVGVLENAAIVKTQVVRLYVLILWLLNQGHLIAQLAVHALHIWRGGYHLVSGHRNELVVACVSKQLWASYSRRERLLIEW